MGSGTVDRVLKRWCPFRTGPFAPVAVIGNTMSRMEGASATPSTRRQAGQPKTDCSVPQSWLYGGLCGRIGNSVHGVGGRADERLPHISKPRVDVLLMSDDGHGDIF